MENKEYKTYDSNATAEAPKSRIPSFVGKSSVETGNPYLIVKKGSKLVIGICLDGNDGYTENWEVTLKQDICVYSQDDVPFTYDKFLGVA